MIGCVCNFIFVMYMLSCNTLYYILCKYQIYITITYMYLYVIISGSGVKGNYKEWKIVCIYQAG